MKQCLVAKTTTLLHSAPLVRNLVREKFIARFVLGLFKSRNVQFCEVAQHPNDDAKLASWACYARCASRAGTRLHEKVQPIRTKINGYKRASFSHHGLKCLRQYTRPSCGGRLAFQPGAAGLFAPLASVGALLAMLNVGTVLGALVAAGFADFGALLQQVRGVLRATRHEAGREGADVGAVAVELNAAGHHLHVRLAEAGGGAVLAGGNAGMEGIEQGLVLGVHGCLCFEVIK